MARMEVISGARRRRWSEEAKLKILAEAEQPGARIGDVDRRHDIYPVSDPSLAADVWSLQRAAATFTFSAGRNWKTSQQAATACPNRNINDLSAVPSNCELG